MIRPFEAPDMRRLKPNKYSGLYDIAEVFHDDDYYKHTLVDDGEVYCIICFKKYWNNNYAAFFLISEDFPPQLARELKEFVDNAIMDLQAERVMTDSPVDPAIDRWHQFLQFHCEGTREKLIYGQDFRMWSKVKGRDY